MTTAIHYGDEWARLNYQEMVARRFHVISTFTGSCMCSSYARAEADDFASSLTRETGGATFVVIDTQLPVRAKLARACDRVSLTT